ncbi:hypothetical protein, partial [Sneathiella sp.]|uniref:hypothetical protein n=1 Tax=Sneathiella sp. TaxID=1964365 RepID=UPI0035625882
DKPRSQEELDAKENRKKELGRLRVQRHRAKKKAEQVVHQDKEMMENEKDIWDLIRPNKHGSCDKVLLDAYFQSLIMRTKKQAEEIEQLKRDNPHIDWQKPIGR